MSAQDPAGQQRFRGERQILASLEHPQICRLLDGGAWVPPGAADSQPFIVMEYVEGLPITAYCAGRGLGITARLELVRKVCDALSYAHRQLVIHRDVKPDNILVTADRTLKLLAFGTAKLVDGTGDAPLTLTGMRVMTPAYASPRAGARRSQSTVTDVYALGAVLYELLTGTGRTRSHATIRPRSTGVCERDVRPPSTWGIASCAAISTSSSQSDAEGAVRGGITPSISCPRISGVTCKGCRSSRVQILCLSNVEVRAAELARPRSDRRARVHTRRRRRRVALPGANRGDPLRAGCKLANRFLFDFHDQIRNLPGSTAAREMIVATALEYLDSLSKDARNDPDCSGNWPRRTNEWARCRRSQRTESRADQGRTRVVQKSAAMQQELVDRGFADRSRRESLSQAYARVMATARLVGTPQEALWAASNRSRMRGRCPTRPLHRARLGHDGSARHGRAAEVDRHRAGDRVEPSPRLAQRSFLDEGPADTRADLLDDSAVPPIGRRGLSRRRRRINRRFSCGNSDLPDRCSIPRTPATSCWRITAPATSWARTIDSASSDQETRRCSIEALDLAERLASTDSKNATARIELTRSIGKWADIIEETRPAEALLQYRRARSISPNPCC